MTGEPSRAPIPFDEKVTYRADRINAVASELGQALVYAHEKHGITQEVIAERLILTPSRISKILSGPKNLTVRVLSEMALAMECELEIHLVDLDKLVRDNEFWTLDETTNRVEPSLEFSDTRSPENIKSSSSSTNITRLELSVN